MKHMKVLGLCALIIAMMVSCSNNLSLSKYENGPEVVEHVLGMTTNEAITYLDKQNYCYKGAPQEYNGVEYVFSRDKNKSSFTYEAGEMFCFFAPHDTVIGAQVLQRMSSEQSALKLYRQWSRYTAKEVLPDPTLWQASIRNNDRTHFDYTLANTYNEPNWKGMDAFWEDLESDKVIRAREFYKKESIPKEIEMGVNLNNGGDIELTYDTRNYIIKWE